MNDRKNRNPFKRTWVTLGSNFRGNRFYKYRYAAGLLLATLGFALFGLMAHITENNWEEGIYLDEMIRYWLCMLLSTAGVFLLCIIARFAEQHHPTLCSTLFAILLIVFVCLTIYSIIDSMEDYSLNNELTILHRSGKRTILDRHVLLQKLLYGCRVFGRTEILDERLLDFDRFFWRWENDAVLLFMCLQYGLWVLFAYLGLSACWTICAIYCWEGIHSMPKLEIHPGCEKTGCMSIPKVLYFTAATAVFIRVLGPLFDFYGLCWYSGGVPFNNMGARNPFTYVIMETIPLVAMFFVLNLFWTPVSESSEKADEASVSTNIGISLLPEVCMSEAEISAQMEDLL